MEAAEHENSEAHNHAENNESVTKPNGNGNHVSNITTDQVISEKNNNVKKDIIDEIDENGFDTRCGLAGFSPEWLQTYATKRTFIAVFTILGFIQGMSWSNKKIQTRQTIFIR